MLFELGARPYAPRDLYRAYLKQSDVFVGIYAESYGWVAPGMEVSGLEDEYRLAADKPRLVYMKETARREPRLTSFLDGDPRPRAWSPIGTSRMPMSWRSLVADDLALLLTERFVGPPAAPPAAPLPAPRWPLVDRVEELQVVTGLLRQAEVGLVTLTGPGGVGKTSLALAAAHAAAGQFADGAAFVSLETLTDVCPDPRHRGPAASRPDLAWSARLTRACSRSLVPASMLVLVNNVEQLVDGGAPPRADPGAGAPDSKCSRPAVSRCASGARKWWPSRRWRCLRRAPPMTRAPWPAFRR